MSERCGRPLGWTAALLAAWIALRIAMPDAHSPLPLSTAAVAAIPKPFIKTDVQPSVQSSGSMNRSSFSAAASATIAKPRLSIISASPPALVPWQDGGWPSGLPMPALVAGGSEPISTGRDTPPTIAYAPVGKAGPPNNKRRWGQNLYAYSFWRIGTESNTALAPQGQYGGNQSGFILTADPFDAQDQGLAMLFRGAVTPDGADRELALGLRWRPATNIPLSLTAERRFRLGGTDRFAFYAAGGFDTVPIAGELSLNAYGQTGFATGKGGGAFFDAQAKLMHPLGEMSGVRLTAGAGAWAGGQRSTSRLDVGPTVAAHIETEAAPIVLQLDWRLPVAGDVQPKGGLALTLSTGF
jgi:hypothetical protein